MKNKLKEHSNYPYNVVRKNDLYIKNIMSNPIESQTLFSNMSDKDIAKILLFANENYIDEFIKFLFDIKKENITDYLLIYFLENSTDMDKMAAYFSQFIPKERINDIINKSRLRVSKIEEGLRKSIRRILNEIYK